jgi:hypothetical protein
MDCFSGLIQSNAMINFKPSDQNKQTYFGIGMTGSLSKNVHVSVLVRNSLPYLLISSQSHTLMRHCGANCSEMYTLKF